MAVRVIVQLQAKPGMRDDLKRPLELLAAPFRVMVLSQLT